MQLTFINVNRGITDEAGNLKACYSMDGIHIYADGYYEILKEMKSLLL